MRTPRLVATAAALAAAALTLVAGCGGSSKADVTAGLDATQILRKSEAAAKGLTAFRLVGGATVQAKLAPGAPGGATVAQVLAEPVKVDGEGPVNGRSISYDFDATLSGLPAIQANVTKVGGGLYLTLLGTDYRVDVPPAEVAALNPSQLPAGLLSWAVAPREVGRENVDGEPTVHLTALLDAKRVFADLGPLLGSLQGAQVTAAQLKASEPQLAAALKTRTLDMWIGTSDLIPRRITAKLRMAGHVDAISQLRSAALDLDVRFTDIGKAVTITAPTTTQKLDLNGLKQLAG
jgi:hypothetical protein